MYTEPSCTPTRVAFMTGRQPYRNGMGNTSVDISGFGLAGKEVTIAEQLKTAGYTTCHIGKWHLGWHWPKKGGGTTEKLNEIDFTAAVNGGPCDHGFDDYFGDDVPNWPPYAWRENDRVLGKLTTQTKAATMVATAAALLSLS